MSQTSIPPTAKLEISPEHFSSIFPFHFAIDEASRIVRVGRSLARLCPDVVQGAAVASVFRLDRSDGELTFTSIAARTDRLFLLQHTGSGVRLRGQMLLLEDQRLLLFLGSPWLTEPADIERLGLSFADFAIHDPLLDMLLVQQSQTAGLADLQRVTQTLSRQRAELRQANERLAAQQRETRTLALIAERTDNAVILTDDQAQIVWANPGFTRLTGYELAEALGKKPGSLLQGPGTNPDTVSYVRKQIAAGEGFIVELLNYHKTGRAYWVAMEVQPIRDETGTVTNFMAIESDVTERRTSQQRLAILYEASAALATTGDPSQALMTVLEKVCSLLGWQLGMIWRPDARGEHLGLSAVWAAPEQPFTEFVEKSRRFAFARNEGLPGLVWQLRAPQWRKDVTVSANFPRAPFAAADGLRGALAFPVFVGGDVWGVIEIFSRNAEEPNPALLQVFGTLGNLIGQYLERVAAEERLARQNELQRAILAGAGHAIISTDLDGTIRTFNPAAEQMLLYSAAEMVGLRTPECFHDRDEVVRRAAELGEELGVAVAAGFEAFVAKARRGIPDEREWTYIRRDGSRFPVWLSVTALQDGNGKVTGFLGIASDISERKQAERDLLQAKEAAEAADRAKSEFLATMSHEIRTPMNGIIGMASLLVSSPLSPSQRQMADAVRTSGEALMRIIDDLLDFAKIEARRLDLSLEEEELDAILDASIDLLAPAAHEKGLELALCVDPRVPRTIRTDAGRLRQVLINLLGNAVKFTAHGELVVSVSPVTTDAGIAVRFQVRDSGIGLTEAQQARLFQPFVQADSSTSRRFGGTGLGLTICQRLVALMGGELELDSEVGRGTTVSFTIPSGQVALAEIPAPRELALVADPNESVRRGISAALASLGIRAAEVATEAELASWLGGAADATSCDLVLASRDVLGPAGRAALDELRRSRAGERPRVILLKRVTDSTTEGDDEPLSALSKPVRRSQLARLLGITAEGSGPAPQPSSLPPGTQPLVGGTMGRVLVVEDNEINRRLALLMLEKLGIQCDFATNGHEAIESVRAREYDAVLMDCHMPELDGYAATRRIRDWEAQHAERRRTPIIALTASAMSGERERCTAAGMDDYVTKPVKLEALRSVLAPLMAQGESTGGQ